MHPLKIIYYPNKNRQFPNTTETAYCNACFEVTFSSEEEAELLVVISLERLAQVSPSRKL